MKKNKAVLGKGLNSMLGGEMFALSTPSAEGASSISLLPIDDIYPNPQQPRRAFDEQSLSELSQSIARLGLVQPITVKPDGYGRYMIISGERRYRASRLAGLSSLPVYVREAEEEAVLELALVENIQREDLNAIEIALAYQAMSEQLHLTHEAIAERVGKARSNVSNYLRLLRLPSEIQLGLSERKLEMGHARALLQIDDTERQIELYHLIVNEHLSVREVEDLAKAIKAGPQQEQVEPAKSIKREQRRREDFDLLERNLGLVFGSKVKLRCDAKGKGQLSIPFASEEELDKLIMLLERIQRD